MFPYPSGTKYRKGIPYGQRSFRWDTGSKQTLFNPPPTGPWKTAFLVEGETDTMRLTQELTDSGAAEVGVTGMPGIESWKSEWSSMFQNVERVFVILDNDADYNVKARVDAAWLQIRQDLGRKARRVRLPSDSKDVCEYFAHGYVLDDMRELVVKPPSRYKPLDITDAHIPRPVNWQVEGLIGQGDVTMLIGDPYVGKSYLGLSLGLALVQGHETWMSLPLHNHGRVLIVDEENPEDVVLNRLFKLGFQNSDADRLRYLHEQGIRFDRDPDAILEEALAFDPTLIIIDSLTRVHTENENDAGAIARLFNDGIKPLARQTGATVIVLHHTRKPGADNSTFGRTRGSGDITAVADTGLDVRGTGPGSFQMLHSKCRRRLPHLPINARLVDTEDGHVRIVTNIDAPPPF